MVGRNALLKPHIAEQALASIIPPAHPKSLRRYRNQSESQYRNPLGVFQQPAKEPLSVTARSNARSARRGGGEPIIQHALRDGCPWRGWAEGRQPSSPLLLARGT